MTFTDPTLLVALVALGIPLAVHLVGRRRARRVMLPTVRFAQTAHLASRGRRWLRQIVLLVLRLAAVALVVLALAGPHVSPRGGDKASPRRDGSLSREPEASALAVGSRLNAPRAAPATPIRILVVDAAEEAGARLRSADLVAATFGGDTAETKRLARAAAAEVDAARLAAADVVFWVGGRAPREPASMEMYLARGGALVWVPADAASPPDAPLAQTLGIRSAGVRAADEGVTIDAAGYTSDLLGAFEGGTSGDLAAPVFRRRLALEVPPDASALRFHDGAPAIVDRAVGNGRAVLLAAGPGGAWGDLAGRAEFVVLTHSLAEALAAKGDGPSRDSSFSREPKANALAPGSRLNAREAAPGDLTGWFILALAVVLAAEGWLAATGQPRPAGEPSPPTV
jgi:hypothetical protein